MDWQSKIGDWQNSNLQPLPQVRHITETPTKHMEEILESFVDLFTLLQRAKDPQVYLPGKFPNTWDAKIVL